MGKALESVREISDIVSGHGETRPACPEHGDLVGSRAVSTAKSTRL